MSWVWATFETSQLYDVADFQSRLSYRLDLLLHPPSLSTRIGEGLEQNAIIRQGVSSHTEGSTGFGVFEPHRKS